MPHTNHINTIATDTNPELRVSLTQSQWDIVMGCVGACAPSGGGSEYSRINQLISGQLGMEPKMSKIIWSTMAVVNGGTEVEATAWVGDTEGQMMRAYEDALIEEGKV